MHAQVCACRIDSSAPLHYLSWLPSGRSNKPGMVQVCLRGNRLLSLGWQSTTGLLCFDIGWHWQQSAVPATLCPQGKAMQRWRLVVSRCGLISLEMHPTCSTPCCFEDRGWAVEQVGWWNLITVATQPPTGLTNRLVVEDLHTHLTRVCVVQARLCLVCCGGVDGVGVLHQQHCKAVPGFAVHMYNWICSFFSRACICHVAAPCQLYAAMHLLMRPFSALVLKCASARRFSIVHGVFSVRGLSCTTACLCQFPWLHAFIPAIASGPGIVVCVAFCLMRRMFVWQKG